jgi:hypothetical protein
MFGSQALDTAIGLVLVLVVVAQAASAVVDWFSRALSKRSRDLEATIGEMLVGDGTNALPPRFADTSVYQSAQAAVERSYVLTWNWIKQKRKRDWSKARPGYLPAAAFAVAVVEMLTTADMETVLREHDGLTNRLTTLVQEGAQDVVDLKAGLETWFDDTMARLQEAYKRWAPRSCSSSASPSRWPATSR